MEGTKSKETKQEEEEKKASMAEVIPCVELEADVVAGALSSVIRHVSSPYCFFNTTHSVEDIISKMFARSNPWSNFLHFYAVFSKIWPNSRLMPPL